MHVLSFVYDLFFGPSLEEVELEARMYVLKQTLDTRLETQAKAIRLLERDNAKLRLEVGHLQTRLAERRQSFRDLEKRTRTLAGARRAIRELGRKLFETRLSERNRCLFDIDEEIREWKVNSKIVGHNLCLAQVQALELAAERIRKRGGK